MSDFFANQDRARRNTTILIVLFVLAVGVITAAAYAVIVLGLWLWGLNQGAHGGGPNWWSPPLLGTVGGGVLVVIVSASLYRMAQLRGGGQIVAASLGGRRIDPGTEDPDQQKVLNVVQEMAIASGVAVPPVFLLEREGAINAFAAGHDPDDAVIGVTRGAVQLLDRDELQGVIAHEFSHILNGDMRLNLRMIGVLYGVLAIGLAGQMLLRATMYSGAGRSRRRSSGKGGGQALLVAITIGLLLIIIGYAGLLLAKIIKAATSRQREYLADAAAVQFTRHPEGIGGALMKIGGHRYAGRLVAADAEEASHMFFGEGMRQNFGGLLATHPPLPRRIQAVWPGWDGVFREVKPTPQMQEKAQTKKQQMRSSTMAQRIAAARAGQPSAAAGELLGAIGQPSQMHLVAAAAIVGSMDPAVQRGAADPMGAAATVLALVLDDRDEVRKTQWTALQQTLDPELFREVQRVAEPVAKLSRQQRLPLLETLLRSLGQLTPEQDQALQAAMDRLIDADERVTLFEWSLRRILRRHQARAVHHIRPPRVRYYGLGMLGKPVATLLSTLALAGHDSRADAENAFTAAAAHLKMDLQLCQPEACTLQTLDAALDRLEGVKPQLRRALVEALAICITRDEQVRPEEAELFRAVAATLHVPVPPIATSA